MADHNSTTHTAIWIFLSRPKQNKISPKYITNLQTLQKLAQYSPQDISLDIKHFPPLDMNLRSNEVMHFCVL